jgi:hypothetical protein
LKEATVYHSDCTARTLGPEECHVTITGCTDLNNDGINVCPESGEGGDGWTPEYDPIDIGGGYSPPTGAGTSDGGGESTENIPDITIVDAGGGSGGADNPGGRDGSVGEDGGGEGLPGEDPGDFGGDRPNGGIDNPTRTGGGGNPDIFENPGKVLGDLWGGVVGYFNGDYYEKKRKAREGRKLQKEATNLLVELSELEKSAKASQEGINKGFDNLDRGATEWDNSKQNTNPEKFTRTYNEGVDRTVDRFPPVSPEDFKDDDKNTPDGYPKPRYDYPEKEKVERGRRYADYAKKQIDSNPEIYKNPEERKRVVDYGDGAFDNAEEAYKNGNPLEGELWNELGVTAVDVALSLTPGVSLGKDIAEAITGKSIVDGRTLTSFERGLAVAGALSFGVGSKIGLIGKGLKVAEGLSTAAKAGKSADEAADIAKAFERGSEIARRVEKAGITEKSVLDDVVRETKKGLPCSAEVLPRRSIFDLILGVGVAYATPCDPKALDETLKKRLEELGKVPNVKGRKPVNHHYAGQKYFDKLSPELKQKYPEGVNFNENGFPDFSPYTKELPGGKKSVIIEPGNSRKADFRRANEAAGLEKTPQGYTWHHNQDPGKMELVPTDLHDEVKHTGGYSIWGANSKLPSTVIDCIGD